MKFTLSHFSKDIIFGFNQEKNNHDDHLKRKCNVITMVFEVCVCK